MSFNIYEVDDLTPPPKQLKFKDLFVGDCAIFANPQKDSIISSPFKVVEQKMVKKFVCFLSFQAYPVDVVVSEMDVIPVDVNVAWKRSDGLRSTAK